MCCARTRMPMRRIELPAFALLLAAPAAAEEVCAPGFADLRAGGSSYRFEVEVADDDAERARGLMHRESLGRFEGMLFVYDAPQPATFWMENTLIPLDMLFFDEAGRLARVHADAEPMSREVIFGGDEIRYVLEINGGLAETLGIAEGAEIRHPAIDGEAAVWPCL
jgi:uncharacterized protein